MSRSAIGTTAAMRAAGIEAAQPLVIGAAGAHRIFCAMLSAQQAAVSTTEQVGIGAADEPQKTPPPTPEGGEPVAWPMDLAPRDGQTLRLLVRYSDAEEPGRWTPLEDALESWTIGHNSYGNTGEDRWQFVGWDWCQDYYLEAASGTVIGWLPFHEIAHPIPCEGVEALREACQGIADDYQTSDAHHPHHILIPKDRFDAILSTLYGKTAP